MARPAFLRFLASAPGLLLQSLLLGAAGLALRNVAGVPQSLAGLVLGVGLGLVFAAFLRWRLPEMCETAPTPVGRRYTREMVLAMSAYAAFLVVAIVLLKRVEAPALRAVLALLPVAPIGLAIRAMIRFIRGVDEMQQKIELESVSMASASLAMIYMAGGFLQLAQVIDVPAGVAMIWVFPGLALLYGLAKVWVTGRYR